MPSIECVMHELLHHTHVVPVAENLIVGIIVILPKLGILELTYPAGGNEDVDDECSPHLLHLHTVRIINFFCCRAPAGTVMMMMIALYYTRVS